MKKIILLSVFFVICSGKASRAQTAKLHLNVLSSEGRQLYVGFDNQVKLYVDGLAQKKLIVSCSKGSMSKSPTNDSVYIFRFPSGVSDKVTISVSQSVNGKIKKRGDETFTLKAIDTGVKFEKGRFKDAGKK